MAKGATTAQALKALRAEGYKGPICIVKITRTCVVVQRMPEVIHLPKSARREKENRIYRDICKCMMEYKRRKWRKGQDVAYGEYYKFARANVITASCGFSYPRYELNPCEPPDKPKILDCFLDAENKIHARVSIKKFPRILTSGAIRAFFRLNCYSCSSGWIVAQVLKLSAINVSDFEVEFVVEGMAVGAYVWGADYIRFSQTSGGTLHIKVDVGGTPDEKTTIRMSKRSIGFVFKMPQRPLDARAEKIRQNCRGYAHNGYLKQIERKGIERLKAQKAEYYRQHRQRILAHRHEYYLATGK